MKQILTIVSFVIAFNSFSQEKSIDLPIIGYSSGVDRLINVNENLLLYYSAEESNNFFFYDSPNMGTLRWSKIRKEMGYSNYSFESKRGKVLIFPGWMDHGVTPHGSDSIRTTLACNFDFQFN